MKKQTPDYIASEGVLTRGWKENFAGLRDYLHSTTKEEAQPAWMRSFWYRYGMTAAFGLFAVLVLLSLVAKGKTFGDYFWVQAFLAACLLANLSAHVARTFPLPPWLNFSLRLAFVVLLGGVVLTPLGWLIYGLAT